MEEPLAEGVVELVAEATGELVTTAHLDARLLATQQHVDARLLATQQHVDARFLAEREHIDARFLAERHYSDARFHEFRAEMYRALAIQGGVILAGVGVILALVETLA